MAGWRRGNLGHELRALVELRTRGKTQMTTPSVAAQFHHQIHARMKLGSLERDGR